MKRLAVLGLVLAAAGSLRAADVAIGQLQLTNSNGYQALTFYNFTGAGNGGCDGVEYKVCNGVTIHSWSLTLTYTNTGGSAPTNAPPASHKTFNSGASDSIAPYAGSGPGYRGSLSGTWEIPLTGVGGTEPACPPCDYQLTKIEFAGTFDAANIPFTVGSPGSTSQFGANASFDTVWNVQSSDSTQAGFVDYSNPQFFAGQYDVLANDSQSTAITYNVGDVAPFTSDTAPNFGDGTMDILDLVQVLFAVNSVPGFTPAACSDRYDAMDLFPVDAGVTRGGDGQLDVRDLVRELFRVNNLDTDRPTRASRGGVCASASSMPVSSLAIPTEVSRNVGNTARSRGAVEGLLTLGAAERTGGSEERIPVYLVASRDLVRIALTFAVGDLRSQLHFVAAADKPSLVQDSQLGVVAAAWLDGLSVRAGDRLLLGYVAGPLGVSASLKVYGVSASGLDDNREVRVDSSAAGGLRQ